MNMGHDPVMQFMSSSFMTLYIQVIHYCTMYKVHTLLNDRRNVHTRVHSYKPFRGVSWKYDCIWYVVAQIDKGGGGWWCRSRRTQHRGQDHLYERKQVLVCILTVSQYFKRLPLLGLGFHVNDKSCNLSLKEYRVVIATVWWGTLIFDYATSPPKLALCFHVKKKAKHSC